MKREGGGVTIKFDPVADASAGTGLEVTQPG
jgi:hypothetical protein